jgi:hypothetical protein
MLTPILDLYCFCFINSVGIVAGDRRWRLALSVGLI